MPTPSSSAVWPIGVTRSLVVGNRTRYFGAPRQGNRKHAGVDLYCRYLDPVLAVEDGQIVNFFWFFSGTYALLVDHGSFVVNYGEVDQFSLTQLGLYSPLTRTKPRSQGGVFVSTGQTGSTVKAGQRIAYVGRNDSHKRSSMLHFEMYSPGTIYTIQWKPATVNPPANILDPTEYLETLATRTQSLRGAEKEELVRESFCR